MPFMPAVILRRVVATALSLLLLVSAGIPAYAADPETATSPPTIESALGTAKVRLPACGVGDEMTRYTKVKEWKRTLLDTNLRLRAQMENRINIIFIQRAFQQGIVFKRTGNGANAGTEATTGKI